MDAEKRKLSAQPLDHHLATPKAVAYLKDVLAPDYCD
jgi:hypothetical protein